MHVTRCAPHAMCLQDAHSATVVAAMTLAVGGLLMHAAGQELGRLGKRGKFWAMGVARLTTR